MSRYDSRLTAINAEEQYRELLDDRGVRSIEQHRTTSFRVVEKEILNSVETVRHVWTQGDLYWKLSSRFYNDPQYWWVIASFNRKPTESHVSIGETIKIPISLSEALRVVE